MSATTHGGEVTLSYKGAERGETVKLEDFPSKIESLRHVIAPCDKLDVTFYALPLPPRASFVVQYDASGNVTTLKAPYVWD